MARLVAFLTNHRYLTAYNIIIISSACLLSALNADMQGDVRVYQELADDLFAGKLPYLQHVFEYPPYSIPLFVLPHYFGVDMYLEVFMAVVLLGDCALKCLLFYLGNQNSKTLSSLLPLLCYSIAIPFIHFFYLQRYDVWPALISLTSIWLFSSRCYFSSGLALSVGIGVKLYPILFTPALVIFALRQGKSKQFCAGLALGLLPIGLLSFYLPWWRFVEFQTARGLQVESLYASVVWMANLLGLTKTHWTYTNKWYEVHGQLAESILPWARRIFIAGVGGSTLIAAWAALVLRKASGPQLARLMLVPLLAFVALNQVLSPQYMIWLLPLAALGTLEGKPWVLWLIPLATMLTPLFFPSANYYSGLDLLQTGILLVRNLMLLAVWGSLVKEIFERLAPNGISKLCAK